MRSLLISALVAAGLACPASSQTLYVDSAISTPGNGTSWSQAFKDLGPALAAAGSGNVIWVASGFYGSAPYIVPAGVTVKGRYRPGNVTDLQREFNNVTVLYGADSARVLDLGAGSVVDGFTVQNGKAGAPGGGGALIDGVDATIRNCFFLVNNDTAGAGAAVLVRNGANPVIESSVFYLNGDDNSGAAIEIDGASGTYINLTVDTNWFSGLRFKNGSTPTIINSIFSNNGNTSSRIARGIEQLDTGSDPSLSHNLFFNNRTSLYLHGSNELTTLGQVNGLSFSASNLDADPQYEVPIAIYRVPVNSPCVDAGSNVHPPGLQGVYDNGRVVDGNLDAVSQIDIGAYEFSDATLRLPVDNHKHIHINAKSAAGLPVWLFMSPRVSPLPQSLWLFEPFGTIFIDLSLHVVFPLPPNQVLNYPTGATVPAGIPIYVQALTTTLGAGGFGINFSNPAVHITNA